MNDSKSVVAENGKPQTEKVFQNFFRNPKMQTTQKKEILKFSRGSIRQQTNKMVAKKNLRKFPRNFD